MSAAVLDRILGQAHARAVLDASLVAPVHAYLFVGPPGAGKRDAARAFAAALVCPRGGCGACASCVAALAGQHPDVTIIEREGASILTETAHRAMTIAQRTPTAGARQVVVLEDLDLAVRVAPAFLKTLEEPPPTTVFVGVADSVPPELATIASRCLLVEFGALDDEAIRDVLIREGVAPEVAASVTAASAGRLDRARLLAGDPDFATRQERWRSVPERLDGTGATVVAIASELLAGCDTLVEVLKSRQAREIEELTAAAEAGGGRLTGRQAIDDRFRREQRRVRTDEVRAGLATLAEAYFARLRSGALPQRRAGDVGHVLAAIDALAAELIRNPNETLQIQSLLLAIDSGS